MNIDTMPAGTKMNEMIAEHALKMKHLIGDEVPKENRHNIPRDDEIQEVWKNGTECYCMLCYDLPDWSNNINDTMRLIDQFQVSLLNSEDGWYAVITEDVVHTCNREPNIAKEIHGKYWALAEDIPLAVCRVILKSVMK